jgi:hypothetical protein
MDTAQKFVRMLALEIDDTERSQALIEQANQMATDAAVPLVAAALAEYEKVNDQPAIASLEVFSNGACVLNLNADPIEHFENAALAVVWMTQAVANSK